MRVSSSSILALSLTAGVTMAAKVERHYKVTVKATNMAPSGGTCQTPVWIGLHDGSFDLFYLGGAASPALERIAEDGYVGPLRDAFMSHFTMGDDGIAISRAKDGSESMMMMDKMYQDAVLGSAPFCSGETVMYDMMVKTYNKEATPLYLSFASMVLPSNDAFIGNGDPMKIPVTDRNGDFIATSPMMIMGDMVYDAGTEVNDEMPASTPMLGQMEPNTGTTENGVVSMHPGFMEGGNILTNANFRNADFTADGYTMLKLEMEAVELMPKMGTIKVTNMAPDQGTCNTPVFVAIHDGSYDLYNMGEAVTPGFERMAEDGNMAGLEDEFAASKAGAFGGVVGSAPFCGGEVVMMDYKAWVMPDTAYYFSYASMILPSNDAFVANGNPMAYTLIEADGTMNDLTIQEMGSEVKDAGTEVNDELPANTAFFGQAAPDTGVVEDGVVTMHPGFLAAGSVGILDAADFENADFTAEGYQTIKIQVMEKMEGGDDDGGMMGDDGDDDSASTISFFLASSLALVAAFLA